MEAAKNTEEEILYAIKGQGKPRTRINEETKKVGKRKEGEH